MDAEQPGTLERTRNWAHTKLQGIINQSLAHLDFEPCDILDWNRERRLGRKEEAIAAMIACRRVWNILPPGVRLSSAERTEIYLLEAMLLATFDNDGTVTALTMLYNDTRYSSC